MRSDRDGISVIDRFVTDFEMAFETLFFQNEFLNRFCRPLDVVMDRIVTFPCELCLLDVQSTALDRVFQHLRPPSHDIRAIRDTFSDMKRFLWRQALVQRRNIAVRHGQPNANTGYLM